MDGLEAMKTRDTTWSSRGCRHGDVALRTFNLVSYGTPPGGPEVVVARWNSTEIYSRIGGKWKIIHSHWSTTKPELKTP